MFKGYNPGRVNEKIIQIDNPAKQQLQINTNTRVCYCTEDGKYDCKNDFLGPVFPGQTLHVNFSLPYNPTDSIMSTYTNVHLQNVACNVKQTEIILSRICNKVNFMISSKPNKECKLFLTAQPEMYKSYDVFSVQLLPCPMGFTLQNGVCDCDAVLRDSMFQITDCNIEKSVIRRPAKSWIYSKLVVAQNNMSIYHISSRCRINYCIPYSTELNLSNPDAQCQFKRAGILCSQCQHGLSMVFGSSRCMKCTNVYLLISLIVIVAGIVLVVLLYLLNLTVTSGTINGIIFYANVISINGSVFLANGNVFKPLKVFISFVNLDLGIETCFYSGMDSYAKMWLQLFFPMYLIAIAIFIIIASRYSYRIQRLTYTRSLPVLATLFLLSYTGILRTVSMVLFSYSTITELPSGHQQIVWTIDANIPLFGLQFTILFITCLVLFLLLIPFNIILLFYRYLLRFKIINHFKLVLDAFQGSYKDEFHYFAALCIVLRNVFFAIYALRTDIIFLVSTIVLIAFAVFHGKLFPNKSHFANVQELLLLINLTIIYAVSQYTTALSTVTNIMISLALLHFIVIIFYHFLTYTCHIELSNIRNQTKEKFTKLKYWCAQLRNDDSIVDAGHDNYEEYDFNDFE